MYRSHNETLQYRIDAALQQACATGDVPGAIALVMQGDTLLYSGAWGRRRLDDPAPMQMDTVVWIASLTKALTSAAALQLVEQGRLALDEPAQAVLPALGQVQVFEGYDLQGQPRTRPPRRPITLRHLLSHTSGFAYEYWSSTIQELRKARSLPAIASCRNAALELPLLFDPGERWEYGISTDWVGKLIEAASGQSLGDVLRTGLLEPLGMHDTAFFITSSMRARLATVHQRNGAGVLSGTRIETPQNPEFQMGGGGLYGTAGDYLRFLRMVAGGGALDGRRVLSAQSIAQMTRSQTEGLRIERRPTVMPALSADLDLLPGQEKHFGLGFLINATATPQGLPAGSLMWCGLPNAYYWIDPTNNICGVFLTQILPFLDIHAYPLYLRIQEMIYQDPAR